MTDTTAAGPLDVPGLLSQLTLEEKAALLDGSDRWHTEPIERLGIPAVMTADGPHGLRKQSPEAALHDLRQSYPATCFPPAVSLASTWDRALVHRVGAALGDECRAEQVSILLGPGVNMKRSPLCGRNFEYYSEDPWTLMCSYNKVNGVYSAENPWLLTQVLRDEWGFRGLVMSDWDAVNIREHGVAAGLDLEMPTSFGVGARRIVDAVLAGTLSEADVDLSARRVLELVNRSLPALAPGQTFDADAHHALAREAATRSAVVLQQDGGLLPLSRSGGTVAVIGELARTPRYQGAGSSQVTPTRLDDALGALGTALSGSREVTFAPGYLIESERPDAGLVAEAVVNASAADVVVLFLGLPPSYESEGYDRAHMDLPEPQVQLLEAVAAANPELVVVLANGAAVSMPWRGAARALLEGWLLGQAGGSAVVDLLLGEANPSGKLAETLPLAYSNNPTIGSFPGEHGKVRYGEGLL